MSNGASNALRYTIPLNSLRALCDRACHELTVRVSLQDGELADALRDPHMRADLIALILWRLTGHDPPHAASDPKSYTLAQVRKSMGKRPRGEKLGGPVA